MTPAELAFLDWAVKAYLTLIGVFITAILAGKLYVSATTNREGTNRRKTGT